jgi:hypothetical protein
MFRNVIWFAAGIICGVILTTGCFYWIGKIDLYQVLQYLGLIAEIVGGFSIAFAAATYFREKSKDESGAVADQIRMFRVDVLGAGRALIEKLTKYHLEHGEKPQPIPRVSLIEEFTIEWLLKNRRAQYLAQNNELMRLHDNGPATDILNALEELSVRIQLHRTIAKDDLICIKKSFVEMVEQLVTTMIAVSNGDAKMYLALKEVYFSWYKDEDVDRTPPEVVRKRNQDALNAA